MKERERFKRPKKRLNKNKQIELPKLPEMRKRLQDKQKWLKIEKLHLKLLKLHLIKQLLRPLKNRD